MLLYVLYFIKLYYVFFKASFRILSYVLFYSFLIVFTTLYFIVLYSVVLYYAYAYIYIYTIKGSLVGKFASYGRWSWVAFTPSWQRHHHVNPIILSTTSPTTTSSSSSSTKKCSSSEAREFRGENALVCETLCFFRRSPK